MAEGTCSQGFEVNFTEKSAFDSNCPICLELLPNKPFLTECCRHHFCEKCINAVKLRKDECPLCKARPVNGAVDKHFSKELNEKRVYCSFKDKGCGWSGQLVHLKNHLSLGQLHGQCKHVTVKCPNKCKIMLFRKEMKKHVNKECSHRPFTCLYCGHKSVYSDIVTNHYLKCVNYPVTCPYNCVKTEMKRSEMSYHIKICPDVIVSCPYCDVGCKETMKRCDVMKHVESSVSIGQHQALLFQVVSNLKQNNKTWSKDLDLRCQELSSHLESQIASVKDMCDKMEHDLLSSLHIREESEAGKDKLIAKLCDTNKKLELNLSTQHIKQTQLEGELQVMRKENEEMNVNIRSLQSRCGDLENRCSKLKTKLFSSSKQIITDKMKGLYDKMLAEVRGLLHNQAITSTCETLNTVERSGECEDKISKNEWLTNSLTTLQSRCSILENRLDGLQDRFVVEDGTATKVNMEDELDALDAKVIKSQANSTVFSEQHQNIEFWIYGYKLIADEMKKRNWKLYLKTMSEASTQFPNSTSPVIVHVSGYEKAKRNRTTLVTSSFYTAGAGKYKFELHVCVTAYVVAGFDGAKPYMSLRASLLEGEYDDVLTWPFVGSISVTLLNQVVNADHFTKQIWVPHDAVGLEHTGRVAVGQYRRKSWGSSCFISHCELESVSIQKQYVVNDCMYFSVDASATPANVRADNCVLN